MSNVTKVGFDFDEVKKQVTKDLLDDRIKKAKSKYKTKLESVERARQILRNEERELSALEQELSEGVGL